MSGEWLKLNNRNFSLDSRKEFRKKFSEIQIKEIKMIGALLLKRGIGKHSGKEKVTLDDLFLLHSMDGGVNVDVPWHVAKFLCHKAKGSKRKTPIVGEHLIGKIAGYYGLMTLGSLMNVTLGPETSSMGVAKLVDLGTCRYIGLGIEEMVVEIPEVAGDDDVGAGQAEIGEYDQFYGEFGQWRTDQERFISWNTNHLSQLLAHHHIDHTRYDGTHYSYVPTIPDLGVQQGVNFMCGTPAYSTAPSPSASQFEVHTGQRCKHIKDAYESKMHTRSEMHAGQRCMRVKDAYVSERHTGQREAELTSGQPSQRLHDLLKMNVAEYELEKGRISLPYGKASQILEQDSHRAESSLNDGLTTASKMVINSPCLNDKKELAIPEQAVTGKESTNPLMANSLPKTIIPTKLVKPQDFNLRPNMDGKAGQDVKSRVGVSSALRTAGSLVWDWTNLPKTSRSYSYPNSLNEVSSRHVSSNEPNDSMRVQPCDENGLKRELVPPLESSGGQLPFDEIELESLCYAKEEEAL
nr:hypothetical protein [Tanacetum cinerariifolium]